jgi:hypothetical protein
MNRNSISISCCDVEFEVIRLKVKNGSRKKDKNSLIVVLAKLLESIVMLDFGLLLVDILTLTNANNIISIDNEAKTIYKNILMLLSIFLIVNNRNKGN